MGNGASAASVITPVRILSGIQELDQQSVQIAPLQPLLKVKNAGEVQFDHFTGLYSLIDQKGRTWFIDYFSDMESTVLRVEENLPSRLERIDWHGDFYYFEAVGHGIQAIGEFKTTSAPDLSRRHPRAIPGLESAAGGVTTVELDEREQFYALSANGQMLSWQEYAELKENCVDPETGDLVKPNIGSPVESCPYQWVVSPVQRIEGLTYDGVVGRRDACFRKVDDVYCATPSGSFQKVKLPIPASEIGDLGNSRLPDSHSIWVLAKDGRLLGASSPGKPWTLLAGRWRRVVGSDRSQWIGLDDGGTIWELGPPIGKEWMKIGRSGGVRDLTDSGYYIRDDGKVLLRHTVYRSETPVDDELITVTSVPQEATVTITSTATAITASTATATAP
jgi:hypothetical protein